MPMTNPYIIGRAITDNKIDWHNSDKIGDKEGKNAAKTKAAPYYDYLKKIGRKDLADEYSRANDKEAEEITARLQKEYEATYAPKEPSESPSVNQTNAAYETFNAWKGTEAKVSENDEYRKGKTDEYDKNAKGYYDEAAEYVKDVDPFETSWGKNTMKYYAGVGEKEAEKTLGEAVSDNEGNIDSFASANSARQYYSNIALGTDKVTSHFLDRSDRLLDIANGYGTYANNSKVIINEGNKNYQDHSSELLSAGLSAGQGLAELETKERMNESDNSTTRYQTDASERMNKDDNDKDEAVAKTKADADVSVANVSRDANQDSINFEREKFGLEKDVEDAIGAIDLMYDSGNGSSYSEIKEGLKDKYGVGTYIYNEALSYLNKLFKVDSEDDNNAPGDLLD